MAGGFGILLDYESSAGVSRSAPARWPSKVSIEKQEIERIAGRRTLLFFAHPACPCTKASFEVLARVLSRAANTTVHVILYIDEAAGLGREWAAGQARDSIDRIPGARVHFDDQGALAREFGARTSGHALLYDFEGELVFEGGVTAARGSVVDSAGASALLSKIFESKNMDSLTGRVSSPVFGCPIISDQGSCVEKQ